MRNSDKVPAGKQETIFEMEYRLKQESKKIAELNKNKKVDRYLLK